jgi:thymidylate synthase (FAD)
MEDIVGDFNLPCLKIIEYVGRVCYNSYDKITSDSYKKFLSQAAKRGHRSIFEFSNLMFAINVTEEEGNHFVDIVKDSKYLKIIDSSKEERDGCYRRNLLITGSLRAFIELLEFNINKCISCKNSFDALFSNIFNTYKEIITNWVSYNEMGHYYKNNANVNCLSDITLLVNNRVDKNRKILVELITDKGLHNELVRHRVASHMAESQRYVRYGDEKNPLNICVDSIQKTNSYYVEKVKQMGEFSINLYRELLKIGNAPQIARAVLPVGTAMKSFIYCDMNEWEHIFRLRSAKEALPMAQEVTKEIYFQMINKKLF